MDWEGRLAPGLNGVRLLVLTLFCWGSNLAEGERQQWERVAHDFEAVLEILAQQAGLREETVGNLKGRRTSGRER